MDNRSNNPGNNSYEKKPFTRPDEKTELLEGNMIDRRKVPADGTVFIGDSLQSSQFDEKNDAANNNLKKILIIAIISLLLIAGFFLGRAIATMTAEEEIYIDPASIRIIGSDIDWDSKVADDINGRYQVYDIIYVENTSAYPIVKMDFKASNSVGEIPNYHGDGDPYDPITAYGYVKAGDKGIMVADISIDQEFKDSQIGNDKYEIVEIFHNKELDPDYEVPTGRIYEYHGGEYYDVMIDNPNSKEASQDSLIAAFLADGDRIKEADATGRLDKPIPAGTMHFLQKNAFYDPTLNRDEDPEDLKNIKIYVIDRTYYESTDETDEDDS